MEKQISVPARTQILSTPLSIACLIFKKAGQICTEVDSRDMYMYKGVDAYITNMSGVAIHCFNLSVSQHDQRCQHPWDRVSIPALMIKQPGAVICNR